MIRRSIRRQGFSCRYVATRRTHESRRDVLRIMGVGSLRSSLTMAHTLPRPAKEELLLKGGRVIDPSQSFNAVADVALAGGRIAAIARDIDARDADRTVPVAGHLVTPGLVDLHTHGFAGISHWGVDLDQYCIARGVTTADRRRYVRLRQLRRFPPSGHRTARVPGCSRS